MEEYPQITFVSTGIQQIGPTSVELTGDLTIKGVTNTVTIPFEFEGAATDPFGNLRVGFEAQWSSTARTTASAGTSLSRPGRPGQRQGHPRIRGLRDQDRLRPQAPSFAGSGADDLVLGRPRPATGPAR